MKVKLENVGVIKNEELEFIPGVNIILGASGSGKSTLMRAIHNTVLNDFSDSDISFGKTKMSITIEDNGNTVQYVRQLKSKDDKCYYCVNGEKFVKVGRQPLQNVTNAIKIGDIEINGDKINFNFNLQFSAPFLILGSQSTLYNVLTYRSTFDIASINDYYNTDIKCNTSDIASNNKLKDKLINHLDALEIESNKLSSIEDVYSQYVNYKHELSIVNDLKRLSQSIKLLTLANNKITELSVLVDRIKSTVLDMNKLNVVHSYKLKHDDLNRLIGKINLYNEATKIHERAISDSSRLLHVHKVKQLLSKYNDLRLNIELMNKLTCNDNATSLSNEFIHDVYKQHNNLLTIQQQNQLIKALNTLDTNSLNVIHELMHTTDIMANVKKCDSQIHQFNEAQNNVLNELKSFKVCPLCGNELNNCGECDGKT